jgi:DNA replication and repair protein RecF
MALALDRRPRQAASLAVRRLALVDFRGYAQARLETDRRPVVLTGPNGAGKTNLLEAISFLAPGRGLRRARLGEIDRIGGAGPWSVAARLEAPGGAVQIRTGRAQGGERERRVVQIDGSDVDSQAVLAEVVAVVWLVPALDRLFQDGAGERRRFLDRLVVSSDPAHAAQLARYAHAVRQRAQLLRAGRLDPSWLGALERQAAAAGVAVAAARRETVRGLAAALSDPPAGFPQPNLALEGEVEAWLDESSALEAEERFGAALAAARRQDAETGITAIGPHRSDLLVHDRASGRPARDCSTGQQKALLVSLVLAEARLRAAAGERQPLLLLDEVAAHLDAARRAALLEAVCALGAQAWLTGTDAATFAPLGGRAQFFTVQDATLQAYDPTHAAS